MPRSNVGLGGQQTAREGGAAGTRKCTHCNVALRSTCTQVVVCVGDTRLTRGYSSTRGTAEWRGTEKLCSKSVTRQPHRNNKAAKAPDETRNFHGCSSSCGGPGVQLSAVWHRHWRPPSVLKLHVPRRAYAAA